MEQTPDIPTTKAAPALCGCGGRISFDSCGGAEPERQELRRCSNYFGRCSDTMKDGCLSLVPIGGSVGCRVGLRRMSLQCLQAASRLLLRPGHARSDVRERCGRGQSHKGSPNVMLKMANTAYRSQQHEKCQGSKMGVSMRIGTGSEESTPNIFLVGRHDSVFWQSKPTTQQHYRSR